MINSNPEYRTEIISTIYYMLTEQRRSDLNLFFQKLKETGWNPDEKLSYALDESFKYDFNGDFIPGKKMTINEFVNSS